MKFRALSCCFTLSLLLGFAPRASAHVQMTTPMPRELNNTGAIKTPPCGPDAKPATAPAANTFKPGATLTVVFTEVIVHPGWFRLELDPNGQAAFVDPTKADYDKFVANPNDPTLVPVTTTTQVGGAWLLADYLFKHTAGGGRRTTTVTLPNVTCDKCTLQLIQVMADAGHPYPGSRYYHCADIVLSNAAPGTGGAGGGAGAAGTGGAAGSQGNGGAASTGGAGGGSSSGGAQATGGVGSGGATAGSNGSGGDSGTSGSAGDSGSSGTAGDGTGGTTTKRASGGCSFAGSSGGSTGALLLLIAGLLYFRPGSRRMRARRS